MTAEDGNVIKNIQPPFPLDLCLRGKVKEYISELLYNLQIAELQLQFPGWLVF